MSQNYNDKATLITALEWHIANGADEKILAILLLGGHMLDINQDY